MKTSGARDLWLNVIAGTIQDGGSSPPSMDRLQLVVPPLVGTAINDGHVTAAIVFGEDRRDDFKAGQRFIVEEMVQTLVDHNLVAHSHDGTIRWIAELDGEFRLDIDGRTISIFGQRERRMSRERNMLGERNERTGEVIGPAGLFASGNSVPFELEVIGPRGGHEKMKLTVHPLALVIPPMTEAEREGLRASIARDGVKVPLVIYQKKILDGRNRGYFASILKKPVKIEEFVGTEEEAKRHVAILNLHRRHLSIAQQAVILIRMFGEEERRNTARNQGGRPSKKPPPNSGEVSSDKHEREWAGRLAQRGKEMGMANVTRHAIESMAEVMDAKQTLQKVDSGEIRGVASANAAARIEREMPKTLLPKDIDDRSIVRRLGRCVDELNKILAGRDGEITIGAKPELISPRLDDIEALIPKIRYALRQRNIIP